MNSTKLQYQVNSRLYLPGGDQIVLTTGHKYGDFKMLNDANSNAYRLNKSGEVIWQVQRDDSNHPSNWWEILHSNARNQGHIGAYEPFTYIWLKHQDGSLNTVANTGSPPEVAIWLEDSQILLAGSAYQQYILDPETGIAKNVTEGRPRPW